MHGARLLGGTEIDAQISRAARVNMAMGGSGAAAARALRIASDSAATGSTRGNDPDDIRRWYASMKIDNDGAANASPPRASTGGGTSILDLPEDVCLSLLSLVGTPLLPGAAAALAGCCKAMRRMPALRKALAAVKVQHQTARALATRCGTTPERMGASGCARLAWNSRKLQAADAKLLAGLVQFMPRLGTLDMRFNQLGDEGLMALASASVKGWLPNLTVLGLSNNKITTGGAKALASAAAGCPPAFETLEQLSLAFNEIDGEGLASLALAMGDGALPKLLTFYLDGNKSDAEVVQQALLKPSNARLAAAKRAGGNAWDYIGGHCVNTLNSGCGYFGRCWLRQAVDAIEYSS